MDRTDPRDDEAGAHVENAGAADIVLTASDLREFEDGASRIKPSGDRYPPQQQRLIDR